MWFAKLHLTKWLIIHHLISNVRSECSLQTIPELDWQSYMCIDATAEDFVYTTYPDTFPINVKFQFELKNVSVSNSYIVKQLYEIIRSAHDSGGVKIKISNNLTDMQMEEIMDIPYLRALDISENSLETFPNLENRKLEYMYLSSNNLDEILGNYSLGYLVELVMSSCNIRRIGKHVFRNTTILQTLDLSANRLKSLNSSLSLVCGLQDLDLSYNLLESFDQSDFCQVSHLHLMGNKLFTINFDFQPFPFNEFIIEVDHIGKFDNISIKLKMNYTTLPSKSRYRISDVIIENEKISLLPSFAFVPHNRRYEYEEASSIVLVNSSLSQISDNAFNGLTQWHRLVLRENNIGTLKHNLFNNTKLSLLDLSCSNISSVETNAFYGTYMVRLNLEGNIISQMNSNSLCNTGVVEVDLSNNKLESFEYLACENVIETLYLQFNSIENINSLGNLGNLLMLNVSHNKIRKLDPNFALYFSDIQYLDLSHNLITTISANTFSSLEKLEALNLENNNLTVIDPLVFSYENFKLQALKFSYHGILRQEQFSMLPHLKLLSISNSKIFLLEERSLVGLIRLNKIEINNTTIDAIKMGLFEGLSSLKDANFVAIFKNQSTLKRGIFEGLQSMLSLNISNISLQKIEHNAFEGLKNLNKLVLSRNAIREMETGSFLNLETLRSLYLDNNRLVKLNIGVFTGLDNLEVLDISYNSLQVIKNEVLFPMRNLLELDLSGNLVIQLDHLNLIQTHQRLRYFGLKDNLFKCDYLLVLLGNFTMHDIYYKPKTQTDKEIDNIDGINCVDICKFVYCPEDDQYYTAK